MNKFPTDKTDGDNSTSTKNSSGVYMDLGGSFASSSSNTNSSPKNSLSDNVHIGTSSLLGMKHAKNEDRACQGSFEYGGKSYSYAGVFDGHGGYRCADYMAHCLDGHIKASFQEEDAWENGEEVMKELFNILDTQFCEQARRSGDNSGSCATVALVREDTLLIGNIGDCSAVMVPTNGKDYLTPVEITHDHRADSVAEYIRIKEAGGSVSDGRVNKLLHPSRTFGDLDVRDMAGDDVVIPEPDVDRIQIRTKDKRKTRRKRTLVRRMSKGSLNAEKPKRAFCMIGSDGVWDFVEKKEAANCVKLTMKRFKKKMANDSSLKPEQLSVMCAANLVELARRNGSDDDMTAAVLLF